MPDLLPITGTTTYLWHYLPSPLLSSLALFLFLALTAIHTHLTLRTRTPFNHVFALGGLLQILGYGLRLPCYWHTNLLLPYLLSNIFIVLAPIFYAASIYMCLSRIVRSCGAVGKRASVLRAKWITRVFLGGDLVALNVQGNGAGLAASQTAKTAEVGRWIVIAGLVVQLVVFVGFVVVAGWWQGRMGRGEREKREWVPGDADGQHQTEDLPPWRRGLYMLYACSALIGVRSVFRLVEYVQGQDGYLLRTEWPLYVFDTLPMLATQLVYLVWFPHEFKVETGSSKEKWMRLLKWAPKQKQVAGSEPLPEQASCRESQEPLTR